MASRLGYVRFTSQERTSSTGSSSSAPTRWSI